MARGENTAHHPSRKVDRLTAYALLQAADQGTSPSAHAMHETRALVNPKYEDVAKDMGERPETIQGRVTLAKGGIII